MKKWMYSIMAICMIGMMSCGDEEFEPSGDSTFIFGSYYGFCAGNCTYMYKIEDGNLYADVIDMWDYTVEGIDFSNNPLSDAEYELAFDFYEDIPENLVNSDEEVFGIPDAYDQGGYLIAIIDEEGTRSWRLDTNRDALPEWLRDYAARLDGLIDQLKA